MTRIAHSARISGLLLALTCFPAAGALPLGIPLDVPQVSLTLFAADLLVRVVPNEPPFLVAESLSEDGSGGAVEVENGLEVLAVRRADDDRGLRLRFSVTLRPGQVLNLVGEDLVATIDGSAASREPGTHPASDAATGPAFNLQLDRSQLTLLAVGGVLFSGTGTWLRADATDGPMQLGLVGGSAELHGHRGPSRWLGEGADLLAEGIEGELTAEVSGGSFEARQGAGLLTAKAHGAALRLSGWQGPMSVVAHGSSLEALACGGNDHAFELTGTEAQLSIDGQRGTLTAKLEGGGLVLAGMQGEARLEGRAEAQLTVSDFAGALVVALEGGAAAGVKNVAGLLRARVEDGRIVLDAIERLDLSASRSEVIATGIRALARSELADGTAQLDLTRLTQGPRISLVGRAEVSLTLPTPCIVKAVGAQAFEATQLEVTGCDFNAPGQGTRTSALRRTYGGQALVLSVHLDPTSHLEVEGKSADPP